MSSLSRRIEAVESRVAALPVPAPDHGRLTDEQLLDIIWREERPGIDAPAVATERLRAMSDAELGAAILRAERLEGAHRG